MKTKLALCPLEVIMFKSEESILRLTTVLILVQTIEIIATSAVPDWNSRKVFTPCAGTPNKGCQAHFCLTMSEIRFF